MKARLHSFLLPMVVAIIVFPIPDKNPRMDLCRKRKTVVVVGHLDQTKMYPFDPDAEPMRSFAHRWRCPPQDGQKLKKRKREGEAARGSTPSSGRIRTKYIFYLLRRPIRGPIGEAGAVDVEHEAPPRDAPRAGKRGDFILVRC